MAPHVHNPPAISASYALSQRSSIAALLSVAATVPFKSAATEEAIAAIRTPGELVEVELPALPQSLLDEYARWTTGSTRGGGSLVPSHLFPQWTFPPMIQALSALPFPMTAVLNQGCRLEVHGPLPGGEAMQVTAQLTEVVREAKKIKITTKITSGTKSHGPACTAYVYAVIPQKAPKKASVGAPEEASPKAAREPAAVPECAELVAEHALQSSSGRHYAFLSGDFNPIHSLGFYAKLSGFPAVILHGFGQMALMQESLVRSRCGGDAAMLQVLDVRFVAPLVLPGAMRVSVDDAARKVFVTNGSGTVTMIGDFELGAARARL